MWHKDPLLHFLVIGGILFAGLSLIARDESDTVAGEILIFASQVAEIERAAELLRGRELTQQELRELVSQLVRDEVFYRNALDLGLDADDSVVRQRMIEKMRELAENVVNPLPPDADVAAWFDDNAARFRIPPQVTFDHLFFSPDQRGESVRDDAASALQELANGADPTDFGDPTPLNTRFEAADDARVRILFGAALTDAVFAAEVGEWIGPFESDFGWHLVRLTARTDARDPAFDEIEGQVREAFSRDQLASANEAAYADMRARYAISVQWSEGEDPEAWP